jgi:alginate O-acetyltransferase complex protein AlgI
VTFLIVVVGWTFFRSDSLSVATFLLEAMAGLHGVDWAVLDTLNAGFWALVVFAFAVTNFAPNTWEIKVPARMRYAVILGLVAAVCILLLGQPSPFLYFQF